MLLDLALVVLNQERAIIRSNHMLRLLNPWAGEEQVLILGRRRQGWEIGM